MAGNVVYKAITQTMDSIQEPGEQILAYKFMHADGSYIGRTSELPNLLIRLGGISEKRDEVMMVRDTGDVVVLKVKKDPNQRFWVTNWYGEILSLGTTGFADVRSVPMADPLFVTFLVSMQFRNKGLFSPLVNCILLLLLVGAVCFGVRKWRQTANSSGQDEDYDLAELLRDNAPVLEQGCCAGNRPR